MSVEVDSSEVFKALRQARNERKTRRKSSFETGRRLCGEKTRTEYTRLGWKEIKRQTRRLHARTRKRPCGNRTS